MYDDSHGAYFSGDQELFHDDVEIGPELHERNLENRRVDGAVEPLIAATHSAGELGTDPEEAINPAIGR